MQHGITKEIKKMLLEKELTWAQAAKQAGMDAGYFRNVCCGFCKSTGAVARAKLEAFFGVKLWSKDKED